MAEINQLEERSRSIATSVSKLSYLLSVTVYNDGCRCLHALVMRIHTSLTIAALTLFATAIFGRPSVHLDERPQFPDIDRVVLRAVEYAPPAGTGDHCLNAPDVLAGT